MGMTIEEAIKIHQAECEGTVDECAKCPIGKKMAMGGQGEGFTLVFSVCELLNFMRGCLERPEEYIYKPDY